MDPSGDGAPTAPGASPGPDQGRPHSFSPEGPHLVQFHLLCCIDLVLVFIYMFHMYLYVLYLHVSFFIKIFYLLLLKYSFVKHTCIE